MIKVSNLSKVFRTEEIETTALNGVSFEIKDGEFVAIMGPSGCGKSTLLNILGLLDNPSEGSYLFCDTEVSKLKEKERTRFRKGNIGFVFQSFNLIDELNVYDNIELPFKSNYLDRHIACKNYLKKNYKTIEAQKFMKQLEDLGYLYVVKGKNKFMHNFMPYESIGFLSNINAKLLVNSSFPFFVLL